MNNYAIINIVFNIYLCCYIKVSHQVASLMDVYPTVVEMAGLALPKDIVFDGQSLLDTLLNQTEEQR